MSAVSLVCRLCLQQLEGTTYYPLFRSAEVETKAITLAMQVSLCTAITISRDDNLPQMICMHCHSFICNWYNFRRKCQEADSTLKATHKEYSVLATCIDTPLEEKDKHCNVVERNIENSKLPRKKRKTKVKHDCSLCPQSFSTLRELNLHKEIFHLDATTNFRVAKPWYILKCCGKTFKAKRFFCHHVRKYHPGDKPYFCDECGKKGFTSEETLRRHKMLHSGRYACELCGKTFTCRAILKTHVRDKHENDRPFVCDVCGKAFVTELLLTYHLRFHTGEKKYVCEMCGVAFVTSSSLAKHRRTHSQVKPHVCQVCGKGFIVRGRLVEHLRTHTGERPFSCEICGKTFTMQDKLRRHHKTHTDQKPFCCDICGYACSTKRSLDVHHKTHVSTNLVIGYLWSFVRLLKSIPL